MPSRPSAPLRVRLRPDLIAVPVDSPRGRLWHLKDPIALRFYQFDSREFALLRRLDGRMTIQQLISDYQREFAPHHLEARQVLFFIDEARKNGLLVLEDPPPPRSDESPAHTLAQRSLGWAGKANVLAIRLPGIDPDDFLRAVYPLIAWMFSPAALVAGGLLILSALALVTLRFEEFLERLPDREAFFTPQGMLWLAAALMLTKILHELAHAFTCRHFGGECHELGIMLLVFVPCLYCNVSDSWLLARRRERMLITAAGMWTELILAALATFVWWFAAPGPVQMAALSVMLIGSVNTLLLNGNPLMRYDGYYLFSDLVRVPNLSTEASRAGADAWRQWGFGLPPSGPRRNDQPRALLIGYALASLIYRTFVVGLILLGVHALGREFRLQVLAWIITLLSVGSLVAPFAVSAARPLFRRSDRRRISTAHALATLFVLGSTAAILLLLPVPYHLYAPFVIDADEADRLLVTVPGQLASALPAGARVASGDLIGRLENPKLELQQSLLKARRQLLQRQLDAYTATRTTHEETAARIPATREAIADLDEQLQTLTRKLQRLELRAPRSGTVLSPPNIPQTPVDRENLPLWSGSPLDPVNRGCYLETGVPLCLIGDPHQVTATVIVPQADLPFVRTQQAVELLLSGLSDRTLSGVVTEVSPVPVDILPREIAALRLTPVAPDTRDAPRPLEPVYRVRVQVHESQVPVRGSTGEARIRLASEPLAFRLWRGLQRTFHFEL